MAVRASGRLIEWSLIESHHLCLCRFDGKCGFFYSCLCLATCLGCLMICPLTVFCASPCDLLCSNTGILG